MTTAPPPQRVSRGHLITLGVVAGLAALAALYVFVVQPLLVTEGTADVATAEPPTARPVQATDPFGQDPEGDAGAQPLDDTGAPLQETFEVFTARDPFQQLVRVTNGGTSGTDGGTSGTAQPTPTQPTQPTQPGTTQPGMTQPGTTQPGTTQPGTTQPGTTQPGTTQPGTTQPGTTRPGTTQPSGTRVGETVVRVIEVSPADDGVVRATVTVNGEGFTVARGEVFARSFRVLDVTGDCVTLLFGDSRFTLCAGEEIRK